MLLAYAPISSLASLDPNTLTSPSAYSGGTVNRFPEVLPLLVPATIMLIPYVDLLLAVVRRTRAGQSPFAADKKHLQHRLLDIGHSHRTSVLIMYLWATLFAGTVVLLSIIRTKLPVLGVVTAGRVPGPALADHAAAAALGPARCVPADACRGRAGARGRARNPALARPPAEAARAGQAGPAGYDAPAGYDPPGPYDAPARYDTPGPYGAADHRTVAAGLAGLSGPDGRSAEGLPGGAQLGAGRPGERSAAAWTGPRRLRRERRPAGTADARRATAAAGGHGYRRQLGRPGTGTRPLDRRAMVTRRPARPGTVTRPPDRRAMVTRRAGQAGNGNPAEPDRRAMVYRGGARRGPAATGDAGPAGPPWAAPAGSGWDAPAESRWDAPPEPGETGLGEPGGPETGPPETEPADPEQQPEAGRPAWPGDYPEAQESLLPWRFG